MAKIELKGPKEILLESANNYLLNYLSTSLPDLSIIMYIYEEIFTFISDKNISINLLELNIESNTLATCISIDLPQREISQFKYGIEEFLSQTGINFLIHKHEMSDKSLFSFNYNFSYLDDNFVNRRHRLIHSYWKNSTKIIIHD
ncbi:MAG: hypothetical protein ACP5O2_05005 [Bacteroidales bacterium]